MRHWRLTLIGVLAVTLSAFYLMTVRVYGEGEPGQSVLVLKPHLSLEIEVGGGEDGTWARAHPGAPPPWWQSDHLVTLADGGDMENPVAWTWFYDVGITLTQLLWIGFVLGCVRLVLRRRGGR